MANPLVEQLSGAVRRTPGPRRLLLLGAVLAIVAAVAGVAMWAAEPSWVVLYRDVSLGEAGRMTEALEQAGIRNKLGPDGTEVMVSRDDRPRARVLLAKAQLPSSGRPGFELFEQKQDWGMTDFTQRITYQRALEGELARTIGGTTGVDRAEVHLTIPEPGALRRLDRPAKAAVLLKMRPGLALAPGAVQGIVATVSNSVDRLSPENIAVTDESGRLLSAASEEGVGVGGAGRRMEIQRSVEEYLAQKAEPLLASVNGLGQPRVQISAQLNFDQVERTIESFDPDGQVLQNEGRSETEAPADGSSGGAQTVVNNTYQNSRKLEKIVSGGAGVTRLTVAVLVDQRAMAQDTVSNTPVAKRIADVQAAGQGCDWIRQHAGRPDHGDRRSDRRRRPRYDSGARGPPRRDGHRRALHPAGDRPGRDDRPAGARASDPEGDAGRATRGLLGDRWTSGARRRGQSTSARTAARKRVAEERPKHRQRGDPGLQPPAGRSRRRESRRAATVRTDRARRAGPRHRPRSKRVL